MLDSRTRCVALTVLAACSTSSPPEPLHGTHVTSISTWPPLPTSGTASYRFTYTPPGGNAGSPFDDDIAITGTGTTRTVTYDELDTTVSRQLLADGRQPDSDTEQQPYARVFATLPPTGTVPSVGATWDIGLPAALAATLVAGTSQDVLGVRSVYSGRLTGFFEVPSLGVAIARAQVRVRPWVARPTRFGGGVGPQPSTRAVGVVDLVVGTGGSFVGILPLRVAYFFDPSGDLPEDIDWTIAALQPHGTDLYCLTAEPGVPSSLIASIPEIPGAPFPGAFTACTP